MAFIPANGKSPSLHGKFLKFGFVPCSAGKVDLSPTVRVRLCWSLSKDAMLLRADIPGRAVVRPLIVTDIHFSMLIGGTLNLLLLNIKKRNRYKEIYCHVDKSGNISAAAASVKRPCFPSSCRQSWQFPCGVYFSTNQLISAWANTHTHQRPD